MLEGSIRRKGGTRGKPHNQFGGGVGTKFEKGGGFVETRLRTWPGQK